MNLDRDVLGDAKAKVESSAKNTWRWEVLCGCLVINLMEMAWCQFALAETVRQTADERKMARVDSKSTMRGVQTLVRQLAIFVASEPAAHLGWFGAV